LRMADKKSLLCTGCLCELCTPHSSLLLTPPPSFISHCPAALSSLQTYPLSIHFSFCTSSPSDRLAWLCAHPTTTLPLARATPLLAGTAGGVERTGRTGRQKRNGRAAGRRNITGRATHAGRSWLAQGPPSAFTCRSGRAWAGTGKPQHRYGHAAFLAWEEGKNVGQATLKGRWRRAAGQTDAAVIYLEENDANEHACTGHEQKERNC